MKTYDENNIHDYQADAYLDEMYRQMTRDANVLETEQDGKRIITIGREYCSPLVDIDKFIRKVIRNDKPAYRWKEAKNGMTTTESLSLAKYYQKILPFQACYSDKYYYSEYVELFFNCVKDLGIWGYPFGKPDSFVGNTGKRDGDLFNDLLELIRKEAKSPKFKRKLLQRIANSNNNFISCRDFINALFEKYSKLMVLRIDPGYKQEFADCVTIEEARAHMKQFLNNWRSNNLFKDCVGYIWKLEMGDFKGFHFHMVLFFDGQTVKSDEYYADKICKYWVQNIVGNRGHCTNSNRRKKEFQYVGIGMIDRSDLMKRKYLMDNIIYITKTTQFVKLKASPKMRVCGRSEMRSIPLVRRGKPRINRLAPDGEEPHLWDIFSK